MPIFGLRPRTSQQVVFNFVISADRDVFDVIDEIGFTPPGAVTVTLTIEAGIKVRQRTDFRDLPPGSVVNFINNGFALGAGGVGGNGGVANGDGTAGGAGSNAVFGPGSGRTFNVTNANGSIRGGGGGGGGGGSAQGDLVGPCGTEPAFAGGGGGGGGAGGAGGGTGGGGDQGPASDGSNGNAGTFATSGNANGTGGAGGFADLAIDANGGNGGNGGNWGAAGSNGQGGGGCFVAGSGGAGGAAGKAIELGGGSINWISGASNVMGAVS